jgi:hypothetical protein
MLKYLIVSSFISLLVLFLSCDDSPADSTLATAQVTVINGYGSGQYKAGDTVHIWAEHLADNVVFDKWEGAEFLEYPTEWHSTFIMPAHHITVTARVKTISSFSLVHEKIEGVQNKKNVYYHFPQDHRGLVYLLHGAGGDAKKLIEDFEWMQLIKDLVSEKYAVIVTESEETSLNKDLNGDGIHWNVLPIDSVNNPDYGNFNAITDTFCVRGYTTRAHPRFSVGMSYGGGFSAFLSAHYKFKAGISYCASAPSNLINQSNTPLQFCMAKFDDHPSVGEQGNTRAFNNFQTLTARSVCSAYYLHDRSPAYPERFARRNDISSITSIAIFNELKTNKWLNEENYLLAPIEDILSSVQANPTSYPILNGITNEQKSFVAGQISVMLGEHKFYSDYNRASIKFINSLCN